MSEQRVDAVDAVDADGDGRGARGEERRAAGGGGVTGERAPGEQRNAAMRAESGPRALLSRGFKVEGKV